MKNKIILISIISLIFILGAGYQTKIYFKQGGEEQVVSSGGKITIEEGGIINVAGSDISKIKIYSSLVDFTEIDTGPVISDQTFIETGVTTDDVIVINHSDLPSGVGILSYYVSSANTIKVRLINLNSNSVDPEPVNLKIIAVRKGS